MARKPTTDAARQAWIEADARALERRLRRGEVPRAERSAARALLAEAFDALAAGEAGAELVATLDAAAHPASVPAAAAWVGRRSLGRVAPMGVTDLVWVERLMARAEWAARIERRVARFLEVTGGAALGAGARTVVGAAPDLDFDLTRG